MAGTVEAIGSQHITAIGAGVIVVLVVIGVLLTLLVTRLLARILVFAVVVILAIVVWQQRTHVEDGFDAHACHLGRTFFGVHVDAPDSLRKACRHHRS